MKPSKNRVYCRDINRHKIVFDTEKRALNFIKFNADSIREENGVAPVRAYHCMFCDAWHVTSKTVVPVQSRNERMLNILKDIKPRKQKTVAKVPDKCWDRQAFVNRQQDVVNSHSAEQRSAYLEGEISRLKHEIQEIKADPQQATLLKQKNGELDCIYILRKQFGLKHDITKETENADLIFWKRWAEEKGYLCA